MERRIGGGADPDRRAMVALGEHGVALLRAAASLAEHCDSRKRAAHLADPLRTLADRVQAEFREVRRAA